MYVDNYQTRNEKRIYHETQYQPNYSIRQYTDGLFTNKYISLVNVSPYLVLDKAQYLVLRRNMRDAFLSTANFFFKSRPYLRGEEVIHQLHIMHHSLYGIVLAAPCTQVKVVWYEDYYGKEGTNTDTLDNHRYASIVYKHVNNLLSQDSMTAFNEFVDTYG